MVLGRYNYKFFLFLIFFLFTIRNMISFNYKNINFKWISYDKIFINTNYIMLINLL